MATRLERPRFFEGQYIGSADLEAVIAYARNTAREHALGAHSWGVAAGLELIETAAEGGGVDYFVLPGFAWDGYGRPIVLLEPRQVPAAKFASLPSGDQTVWLRYNEAPFQGLRPGFETCSSEEAYSRIRESVEVEVGSFGLSQREGGIEIAGVATSDARLAPRLFRDAAPDSADNLAPVLCNGAVPHQDFPADTERWLVPIGVATWQSGTPGLLKTRSEPSQMLGRTQRRMAGLVAESLFASDGVIRLRDGFAQFQSGVSLDDLCAPMKTGDLRFAPDALDSSKTTPRLVGNELVWVEGNLRVTGQARLFGTRLELRDGSGLETAGVPLYARRGLNPHVANGQDFEIVIGEASNDSNRLAVGPTAAGYGTLLERFVLRGDGSFAFGASIPATFTSTGLITAMQDATLTLAAATAKLGKLSFHTLTNPGASATLGAELAHIAYDDDPTKKALRVGASTDLARLTYWNASGNVCIGAADPQARLDVRQLGGTESLRIDSGAIAAFDNGVVSRLDLQSSGGALHVHAGMTQTARVVVTDIGRVGIGTDAPTTNLHVRGSISGNAGVDTNHLVLLENTAGPDADVLALRVGGTSDQGNNFISFFDGAGIIGRIEKSVTVATNNPATAGTFLRLLSGGADFAECLPRREAATPIGAGRIVGVRRGSVSLETDGADALMITTDRAVVVGNAMSGAETSEMVAFIGQVYVEVGGPVASGDFILPSGRNDGAGRAVAPGRLSVAEARGVVGRAWSDLPVAEPGQVCVAVGVQGADALSALAAALVNQQDRIEALHAALTGAPATRGD